MNMRGGYQSGEGRAGKDELLRRLEELTNDHDGEGDDGAPGLSEAERMARDAEPPKRRVDGELPGTVRQRPLTTSQMMFAKLLIEGKTQLQAYQEAYPNAKANDRVLKGNAWRLAQDGRIQKLLQEHWGETVEAMVDDQVAVKRYVIKQLLEHSKSAKQEGTKLKALELMGKSVGMFKHVEKEEEDNVSADQLKLELARHLKLVKNVRPITKAQIIDVPEPVRIEANGD